MHAAPPQEAADKHCDQVGRQRVAQRGKRGLDYLIDETGEGAPAGHGEQAADGNEGHDRNQRSRDTGKALGNKFRDGGRHLDHDVLSDAEGVEGRSNQGNDDGREDALCAEAAGVDVGAGLHHIQRGDDQEAEQGGQTALHAVHALFVAQCTADAEHDEQGGQVADVHDRGQQTIQADTLQKVRPGRDGEAVDQLENGACHQHGHGVHHAGRDGTDIDILLHLAHSRHQFFHKALFLTHCCGLLYQPYFAARSLNTFSPFIIP